MPALQFQLQAYQRASPLTTITTDRGEIQTPIFWLSIEYVPALPACSSKGIDPAEALWTQFRQNRLMEAHRSVEYMTEKDYRDWYERTLPSQLDFYNWRNKNKDKMP